MVRLRGRQIRLVSAPSGIEQAEISPARNG
jgi:hypothetical protein